MILAAVALGLAMQSNRAVTFHCGRPMNAQTAAASGAPLEIDGQTARVQSPTGAVVVMKAHARDIHDQGAHLCATSYSLEVTESDGRPIRQLGFGGDTSEWDRVITMRIDGFGPDGRLAYFLAVEGGEHPRLWAHALDLSNTGEERQGRFLLGGGAFIRSISPECLMTLHFAGLSSDNWFVLATSQENFCIAAQFWKVWPIPDRPVTEPTSFPNVAPVRLDSLEGVTPLEPGTVVPE